MSTWLQERIATCRDPQTLAALLHPSTAAFMADAEAWAAAHMPQPHPEGPIPAAARVPHLTVLVNDRPAPALVAKAA